MLGVHCRSLWRVADAKHEAGENEYCDGCFAIHDQILIRFHCSDLDVISTDAGTCRSCMCLPREANFCDARHILQSSNRATPTEHPECKCLCRCTLDQIARRPVLGAISIGRPPIRVRMAASDPKRQCRILGRMTGTCGKWTLFRSYVCKSN